MVRDCGIIDFSDIVYDTWKGDDLSEQCKKALEDSLLPPTAIERLRAPTP